LDEVDLSLLRALQRDGRLSNKELAAEVGLAPSSCLERVRRLREEGVILGFTVDIDPRAVGVGLQAMVAVRLHSHDREAWRVVKKVLVERAEVVGLYHVSGADDLLVHVACRDADQLRDFVMDTISTQPGVRQVETSLVFEHRGSPLPIYPRT
jgi:DNA-binding Lrp family transcriptional regulator